ncbi:MAG TPA: PLDc N-terminal domain-containing protein [Thermoanaerobaculia bacterium]
MTFGSIGLPEILILLIVVGGGAFWIWMLVEAATREAPGSQDRLLWVLIVVLTQFLGAAIYFFVRRPVRRATLGH